MKQAASFRGVYALLLTPFEADGRIDWQAYDRYVDWQLEACTNGLFAVCGSSEMAFLEPDERLALAKRAVGRAGSVPVVATANVGPDPAAHREELLRMAETGVSGVVLVVPQGLGAEPERLEAYFAGLAAASPVPALLYEWPHFQPKDIDPAMYGRLVQQAGIIGVKDTTCTMAGIQAKIAAAAESVVYQANTPLLLEALRSGAGGVMSTVSTVAAKLLQRMWAEEEAGSGLAERAHERLVLLDGVLGPEFTASGKYLAARQGAPMTTTTRSGKQVSEARAKALDVWLRYAATELGEEA